MTPRTRRLEGLTCRGFGERRGRCDNPPGVRTVRAGNERVSVASLCDTCDLLRIQTGREIARGEGRFAGRTERTGGILGLDFTRLDSGLQTRARRTGRS